VLRCTSLTGVIIKMNKSDYGNKLNFQVFALSDSPRKEKTQCPSNTNLMKSLCKIMWRNLLGHLNIIRYTKSIQDTVS
jgi:hypothetical protein